MMSTQSRVAEADTYRIDKYCRGDYPQKKIEPEIRSQFFCWVSGLIILMANKLRHYLQGYITPRTFSVDDLERCVDYDFGVVGSWCHYLASYTDTEYSVVGKNVLELGPGADFGNAAILLARGASSYHSIDVNNLIDQTPDEFYDRLFSRLDEYGECSMDVGSLRQEVRDAQAGMKGLINYVHDQDFDLTRFKDESIGLVVSQAVFEAFEDYEAILRQLTDIMEPGGVLISEVDISTHTRWIRDFDPLNIYRYPNWLFRSMSFPGSPSRIRPHEYIKTLQELGWRNVVAIPIRIASQDYVESIENNIGRRFNDPAGQINALSIMLCATR
ncbi:MAG TPA: methyltransferase domain-containing protein [Rhodospirillales bacterium]|nr:methyltransferase domain-containing protein [Rhodospirillales bacterium]